MELYFTSYPIPANVRRLNQHLGVSLKDRFDYDAEVVFKYKATINEKSWGIDCIALTPIDAIVTISWENTDLDIKGEIKETFKTGIIIETMFTGDGGINFGMAIVDLVDKSIEIQ